MVCHICTAPCVKIVLLPSLNRIDRYMVISNLIMPLFHCI